MARTIKRLARAVSGVTRFVRVSRELLLCGLYLSLLLCQTDTHKIAISNARKTMAGGADLREDLVAATDTTRTFNMRLRKKAHLAWSNDCQKAA